MRRFRTRRPSPALIISVVALLVALGGTAYAGILIPKNSVGTKQLKNGAVTAKKIKKGTVPNANDLGRVPASRYQQTTLRPGRTETGTFGAAGTSGVNAYAFTGITFDPPLAAAIPLANGVFLYQGSTSTTGCPGVGRADPGFLCLYESDGYKDTFQGFGDPQSTSSGIRANGTVPLWNFSGPGWSRGSWAVTAPTASSTAARSSHHSRVTSLPLPLPRG